jgi:hypothetical protein
MTIHIIHLPHREDRLLLLQKELVEQNINDYKIWDGIIDKALPCRGISKAHKQIVAFAKRNKFKQILIAEDDLNFTATDAFDYYLRNVPVEFDIFLGGISFGKIRDDNTVEDFCGLTIYIIRQNFYDLFLSVPEDKDLDRSLAGKGKFVVCQPMIIIQHNGYSDNHKKYVDLEKAFQQYKLFGH